jgi:hypothetical protein
MIATQTYDLAQTIALNDRGVGAMVRGWVAIEARVGRCPTLRMLCAFGACIRWKNG